MGGRGTTSGANPKQETFTSTMLRNEIAEIIASSDARRDGVVSAGAGGAFGCVSYRKCACCGEYTIAVSSKYKICEICGWIDDEYQNNNPDSLNGMNPTTLTEAKRNYFKTE